jgi:acylphosphatase
VEAHATITVNGLVQGVGFRWFASRHAHTLGLSGFVQNNHDDTVLAEVEGEKSAIEEFIAQLTIGPRSAHVHRVGVQWSEPNHAFNGFRIR